MKTLHLAIQDEQLTTITEDQFDFDEILGIVTALIHGVMERAAGDDLTLKKELYSRVNFRISTMLTEFIPDLTWLEPSESTQTK